MNFRRTNNLQLLTMCCAVALFCLTEGTGATETEPRIRFEEMELDAGTVAPESETSHTFAFENVGSKPLVIYGVKSSCNCSTAFPIERPIQPGHTDKVEVTIKHDSRARIYTYSFAVKSNDPEMPRTMLTIRAKVVPQFSVIPRRIFFGNLRQGQRAERSIRLAYLKGPDGHKTEIIDVKSSSKDLLAVYDDAFVAGHNQAKVRLSFDGRDVPGPIAETITITTNNAVLPTVIISVEGKVIGDLQCVPSRIHVGFIRPEQERAIILNIWGTGKKPLTAVPTVQVNPPLEFIDMLKVGPSRYQLVCRVAFHKEGAFSSTISVHVQDCGTVELPVRGYVTTSRVF